MAGKSALFKGLERSSHALDHMLQFPPKHGSLSDLKAVLCDGGFGCLIRDVKFNLHPLFRGKDLEKDIRAVLRRKSRSADRKILRADIEATVSFNTARIRHQCQQQEEWYGEVFSGEGMQTLRAIFRALPTKIRRVWFYQLGYWKGNTQELRDHGLQREFPTCAHPMFATFISRVLKDVHPEDLSIGADLPCFDGTADLVLLDDSEMEQSVFNTIESFDLCHCKFPKPTSGEGGGIIDSWAARQLASFLSCAQRLEFLVLKLDGPDQQILQDKVWLNGIFMHAKFPALMSLRVSQAEFDMIHFITFLASSHKLEGFELTRVRPGTPEDLVTLVRHFQTPNLYEDPRIWLEADLEELDDAIIDELESLMDDWEPHDRDFIEHSANDDQSRGIVQTLWYGCP